MRVCVCVCVCVCVRVRVGVCVCVCVCLAGYFRLGGSVVAKPYNAYTCTWVGVRVSGGGGGGGARVGRACVCVYFWRAIDKVMSECKEESRTYAKRVRIFLAGRT